MVEPSKVTGGEWEVWYDKDSDSHDIVSRDHETIARCITSMDDARLLAASKGMKEALEAMVLAYEGYSVGDTEMAYAQARAALAKADGVTK